MLLMMIMCFLYSDIPQIADTYESPSAKGVHTHSHSPCFHEDSWSLLASLKDSHSTTPHGRGVIAARPSTSPIHEEPLRVVLVRRCARSMSTAMLVQRTNSTSSAPHHQPRVINPVSSTPLHLPRVINPASSAPRHLTSPYCPNPYSTPAYLASSMLFSKNIRAILK